MTERSLVGLLFWLFYRNWHAGAGAVATCGRDAQAEPRVPGRVQYDKCGRQAQAMIDRWMRRQGCGRSAAMRLAVEHASGNNSRE
jgi:hypothetical protein